MRKALGWGIAILVFGAVIPLAVNAGGAPPDRSLVAKGKKAFLMKGCSGCHTIGKGDRSGPDLMGLFQRRQEPWVRSWIKNPEAAFAAHDPIAIQLLGKFAVKMPTLGLQDPDVDALVAYLRSATHGHEKKH